MIPPAQEAAGRVPARAEARARKLAGDAMALDLALAAGDPAASRESVRLLLAHQVAAGHSLTMRLSAVADRFIDYVQPAGMRDPHISRCGAEAVRLSHGAARLMERTRAAALALQRIGWPGAPESNPGGPGSPGNTNGPQTQGTNGDAPKIPPRPNTARGNTNNASRGRLKNGAPPGDFLSSPRCGARTRAGHACAQPAMKNGRCRLHGGKSTGARTEDGRKRVRTARLAHGFRSAGLIALRSLAFRTARDLQHLCVVEKESGFTTKSRRSRSDRGSCASTGTPYPS